MTVRTEVGCGEEGATMSAALGPSGMSSAAAAAAAATATGSGAGARAAGLPGRVYSAIEEEEAGKPELPLPLLADFVGTKRAHLVPILFALLLEDRLPPERGSTHRGSPMTAKPIGTAGACHACTTGISHPSSSDYKSE